MKATCWLSTGWCEGTPAAVRPPGSSWSLRRVCLGDGEDVTLAPAFAGSRDVGRADADWIAGSLLVDVKATKDPGKLPARDIYQLAGYALLDYPDTHRLDRLGWYHARTGSLSAWDIGDFFAL